MIEPIKTELGELHGRDAIYLDSDDYNGPRKDLLLVGAINGNLCSEKIPGEFVPYEIRFVGVSKWQKFELDDWMVLDRPNFHETSSFYQVVDSGNPMYVFQTYDWVFEIQCESYEINFGKKA